jgi:hypothetical protein
MSKQEAFTIVMLNVCLGLRLYQTVSGKIMQQFFGEATVVLV